jgi:hypothetical protein
MHKKRILLLILAALGAFACFLPWVHVPILGSINGVQDEAGQLVLAAFVTAGGIALLGERRRPTPVALAVVASILGAAAGIEGVRKIVDFDQAVGKVSNIVGVFGDALRSAASVGIGLYLVVAAGFGILLSQLLNVRQRPDRESSRWLR